MEGESLTIVSSDGRKFEVLVKGAQDVDLPREWKGGSVVPVDTIAPNVLASTVTHINAAGAGATDEQMMASITDDVGQLYEIINACNFLGAKRVLDACCMKIAVLIRGRNPDQIREALNITNTLTSEEEEMFQRAQEEMFPRAQELSLVVGGAEPAFAEDEEEIRRDNDRVDWLE
jgi:hypothetical protein